MTYNVAVGIVVALWIITICIAILTLIKAFDYVNQRTDYYRQEEEIKELNAKLDIQKSKADYFQTLTYWYEHNNKSKK